MPHVPPLPPASASKEAQLVYEAFYTGMGFPAPPNFILTQGHAPDVARGSWLAVKNILVAGQIPRWIKELLFVAISIDRRCRYCAAAHIACCRMLRVNPEWTEAVSKNNLALLPDPKMRAMIEFGLKVSRDPQGMSAPDFSKLRGFGLGHLEITELVGMAAFAVYANIIADATAMNADDMFDQL
jgi:uncharacterized peroxidase-related enzyme